MLKPYRSRTASVKQLGQASFYGPLPLVAA